MAGRKKYGYGAWRYNRYRRNRYYRKFYWHSYWNSPNYVKKFANRARSNYLKTKVSFLRNLTMMEDYHYHLCDIEDANPKTTIETADIIADIEQYKKYMNIYNYVKLRYVNIEFFPFQLNESFPGGNAYNHRIYLQFNEDARNIDSEMYIIPYMQYFKKSFKISDRGWCPSTQTQANKDAGEGLPGALHITDDYGSQATRISAPKWTVKITYYITFSDNSLY